MQNFYSRGLPVSADIAAQVQLELKRNRFDPVANRLVYTPDKPMLFQAPAYYREWFGPPPARKGCNGPTFRYRRNPFARFLFSWAAWTTAAARPGADYSYTNNWPGEPMAGNYPRPGVFLERTQPHRTFSGAGLVFFIFGRYDILGWHRSEEGASTRG